MTTTLALRLLNLHAIIPMHILAGVAPTMKIDIAISEGEEKNIILIMRRQIPEINQKNQSRKKH